MGGCLDKVFSGGTGGKKRSRPEIQLLGSANQEEDAANQKEATETKLTALYDYHSRNAGDISFKKDEEFLLLSSEKEWIRVRSTRNKTEGYVPSNYVAESGSLPCERWFFGTITRKDSERLLLRPENRKGSFLIRESETSQTSFSLSLLNDDPTSGPYVKHYRIHSNEGRSFFITEGLEFKDLKELVRYYENDPHGLCCQLEECCVAKEVPQTLSLARNVFRIDQSQVKNLGKLKNVGDSEIYEALWNDTVKVVIKPFQASPQLEKELPEEMEDLKKLHHKRLVKFFGVVYPEPVFLVWECTSLGNLLHYLRNGGGKDSTLAEQIDMAAQVAAGMAYLESMNVVHGNLCAESVMVDSGPVFKVTDYGLTKYAEEPAEHKSGRILWTAPESLLHGNLTIKSDIWSFGITVTEIVTKGRKPYSPTWGHVSDVMEQVEKGKRMSKPEECPDTLYEILLQCWDKEPDLRPTFEYIQIFLENFFAND